MKKFEIFLMGFVAFIAVLGLIISIIGKNYTAAGWQLTALCWVVIAFIKQLTINSYERDIK
jgi:Na+/melibiose symporter-like transporter